MSGVTRNSRSLSKNKTSDSKSRNRSLSRSRSPSRVRKPGPLGVPHAVTHADVGFDSVSAAFSPVDAGNPESAPWTSVGFSCGGWLQFYLYGVARAIQAYGLDFPDVKYLGCSAGALASAAIVLGSDFDAAMKFCKEECLTKAHGSLSGLFCLHDYVDGVLELQREKFFDIPEGRLQISVTQLPLLTSERVTKYSSWEDLKTCLLSSCAAFPLAKIQYRNGRWCCDGGFTDFVPVLDNTTISVSPFYFSQCDIKPSRYVPLWWAIVPPKCNDEVDWLYSLGFEDAIAFFNRKGIKPSSKARPELMQLLKNPHPFDVPGRVSLHRVLGYHVSALTQGYLGYFMDFVLFLFLLFVVKPVMLLAIYTELLIQMIWHFSSTVIVEMMEVLPLVLLSTFFFYPNSLMTYRMSSVVFFEKLLILGPSQFHRFKECWQCILHVLSPALLVGFITLPKAFSMEEAMAESLCKMSFTYRMFRHAL
jgi:hypothetical protein